MSLVTHYIMTKSEPQRWLLLTVGFLYVTHRLSVIAVAVSRWESRRKQQP